MYFNYIYLNVEPIPGAHLQYVAKEVIDIAQKLNTKIVFMFEEVALVVEPTSTVAEIVSQWNRDKR